MKVVVVVRSGLTTLSTIFQSYHDGVWLRQGAQCSLLSNFDEWASTASEHDAIWLQDPDYSTQVLSLNIANRLLNNVISIPFISVFLLENCLRRHWI